MAKYAAAEASVRAVDQAVQTPRRQRPGQGVRPRRGADRVALARIAPVSREMILNFVAQTRSACHVLLMTTTRPLRGRPGRRPVTLDSPHNRNALSDGADRTAAPGLRTPRPTTVRAVVLGHTGGTFCAGADLKEAQRRRGRDGTPTRAQTDLLLRAIVELPQAGGRARSTATSGPAASGWSARATSSSRGRTAPSRSPRSALGLAPAIISLTTLGRMSARAASRYYLTGETFDAATAAAIGLITVAADDVDATVAAIADALRRARRRAWPRPKALTTATVLGAFTEHADDLRGCPRGCSDPTRPARACWRSCRNGRRTGLN